MPLTHLHLWRANWRSWGRPEGLGAHPCLQVPGSLQRWEGAELDSLVSKGRWRARVWSDKDAGLNWIQSWCSREVTASSPAWAVFRRCPQGWGSPEGNLHWVVGGSLALAALATAFPVAAQTSAERTDALCYEQALDLGTFWPPHDAFVFRWWWSPCLYWPHHVPMPPRTAHTAKSCLIRGSWSSPPRTLCGSLWPHSTFRPRFRLIRDCVSCVSWEDAQWLNGLWGVGVAQISVWVIRVSGWGLLAQRCGPAWLRTAASYQESIILSSCYTG